ncbi:MAG: cation diffusion facilitator family transporter [Rhodospirillaceae bacterium]|nr:MAG: cation diffusion facilitator family transporter [Rhodospirillaceae bacterium]
MRFATKLAVGSAVLLVVVKTAAYFQTHSVALLSSLVDSVLDILASAVNMIAVRHALTPADAQHRFGHGKAEPLSGLTQAAFVAGSAVLVIVEAASRFGDRTPVTDGPLGIAVMLFSIAVTILLVMFQRYVVKRTGSLAITADSLHYSGDVLLNVSVIVALVLATRLNIAWADAAFGIGIALFLLVNAIRIANASVSALMDHELPEADRRMIIETARRHPKVRGVHELRTRSSGVQQFIQMHIVLDKTLTLIEAHRISDEVEAAVQSDFPAADVIIHQDPEGVAEYHQPVGAP